MLWRHNLLACRSCASQVWAGEMGEAWMQVVWLPVLPRQPGGSGLDFMTARGTFGIREILAHYGVNSNMCQFDSRCKSMLTWQDGPGLRRELGFSMHCHCPTQLPPGHNLASSLPRHCPIPSISPTFHISLPSSTLHPYLL